MFRRLLSNASLGVIAPAGPLSKLDLEAGLTVLRRLGFSPIVGEHALDAVGYLAGDDQSRLDDLLKFFAEPSIDAVIAARGGYGAIRLLPLLDRVNQIAPKLFIGSSDNTALISYLWKRFRLPALYGPMLVSLGRESYGDGALQAFQGLLSGRIGVGRYDLPVHPKGGYWGGRAAEGVLLGGCLSLLAALSGTPYQLDLSGAILVLEDVGEPLYRLDRMIHQLRLGGQLAEIRGLICSAFDGCGGANGEPQAMALVAELMSDLHIPIWVGMQFGHGPSPFPLPLGLRARIDADGLTLLERLVEQKPPVG